jgi:hypothetical protein
MKRLSILFLVCLAIAVISCKKTEIDPQIFVERHLIGAWPIKYSIQTIFIDGIEQTPVKGDTLTVYNPIDTLVFTEEGNAIRRNKTIISTVGYSISADGETITFNSTPAVTKKITFVRTSSVGFGTETTTTVGGKVVKTQIADHLVK